MFSWHFNNKQSGKGGALLNYDVFIYETKSPRVLGLHKSQQCIEVNTQRGFQSEVIQSTSSAFSTHNEKVKGYTRNLYSGGREMELKKRKFESNNLVISIIAHTCKVVSVLPPRLTSPCFNHLHFLQKSEVGRIKKGIINYLRQSTNTIFKELWVHGTTSWILFEVFIIFSFYIY